MKKCGIYKIENILNGKCYIGQSIDLNHRKHIHLHYLKYNKEDNAYLQNAYNKYGKDNFLFSVILYCEPFELTRYEKFFDSYYKTLGISYNIRECADSNKGQIRSEKTKINISNSLIGRKLSDEHKNNISKNRKGIGIGRKSGMFGKSQSEKAKEKIREFQKGKILSEETKLKMSKSKKGKPSKLKGIPRSEETKKKISLSKIKNNYRRKI